MRPPSRQISVAALLLGLYFAEWTRAGEAPKLSGEACSSGSPLRHRARVPLVDRELPSDGRDADAPDREEILEELDRSDRGDPTGGKATRQNFGIQVETIGQTAEPCKLYPLAGACQLVHRQYRCTIAFDERCEGDSPSPAESMVHRVEVVYLDKDSLRRCPSSGSGEKSTPKRDVEQRLSNVEQALERVVRDVEALKASPRDTDVSRAAGNTSPSPPRFQDSSSSAVESAQKNPGATTYRGRLVAPDGAPVVGATITPVQWEQTVHPVSSDSEGRFEFTIPKTPDGRPEWHNAVKVEAAGLARRVFVWKDMAEVAPTIRLEEGVPVSGRIVYRGQPLEDVEVKLVPSDRIFPRFLVGPWKAETDRHGRFQFNDIPKGAEYDLSFSRASLENFGAIAPRHIRIGPRALELDVVDIKVGPAHRVAGRLSFADGRAIPEGVVAYVDHVDGLLTVRCPVDERGRFEVRGLPTCSVSVWFRFDRRLADPPGYRLSLKNRCVDPDRLTLTGKLDRDVKDLVVLFEPGERGKAADESEDDEADRTERLSRPLAGAEPSEPR